MHLEGSCHCGGVKFELDSAHPYPFNLCYCSICRKTTGAGGYAINLGGTALWLWDPRWPELVHPLAAAIDSDLPVPPERTHLMVGSKASWVELHKDPQDKEFVEYPDESIADWHKRLGLAD